MGKTENESLTPQTAHLVARPGLETPLLLVLELHPGNPPLGGRLLVPLLLTLKLSCGKQKNTSTKPTHLLLIFLMETRCSLTFAQNEN